MDSDNVVSERRFHFSRPLKTSLATLCSPTRAKNRLIKSSEKGGRRRRSSRMKRRKGKRQTEGVGEGGSKKKEVSTGTKVPPPFS